MNRAERFAAAVNRALSREQSAGAGTSTLRRSWSDEQLGGMMKICVEMAVCTARHHPQLNLDIARLASFIYLKIRAAYSTEQLLVLAHAGSGIELELTYEEVAACAARE